MIGVYSVHGYIQKGRRAPRKIEEIVYARSEDEAEEMVEQELSQFDIRIEYLTVICLTLDRSDSEIAAMNLPQKSGMRNSFETV